ncbi:DnaB-like helicase C-terminal domain-containing protein [Clostridium ljungdahlii]|uniref:Replicative DNA helicase n=1 Tax=Clostridium ljungdahlii TaxID=1538 RepID=A0A166RL49_9CLOT|nr:DnaB-like helicase C-terminal domain-containing protein [Clostridium ljungdahlii]OAA90891.1 replicative DNA helicase [Clostridium ljungdahlii]
MANIECRLISKILDEQDITLLRRGILLESDFYTQHKTYNFILGYSRQYNTLPPYDTVVSECENFEYEPEVSDHFNYLVSSLKNATAKRKSFELLQKEAGEKFQKLKGADFVNWLSIEVNKIKDIVEVDIGVGTNFAVNGSDRWKSYNESKTNRTGIFIPTPYKSLTEKLGGGTELGDYTLIMAFSNRGKSWIASDIGLAAWRNKFGVLHYSPELSKKQQLDRLDTLNGHFKNSALRIGKLTNEDQYQEYLSKFNDKQEIPYIVKTMEDLNKGLSVDTIEADLLANPDIKMVIIDGLLLMSHKGKGQSNRDALSNTSRALRQLFGKHKVVGIVVHQTPQSAEKENKEKSEAGDRIVKCPELHQYSESIATIQDACTVLTFDAFQGSGKIKIAKARCPHVDEEIELHTDFDNGFIREVEACDYF